jgi:hypothetical protein
MTPEITRNPIDQGQIISDIHQLVAEKLINSAVSREKISEGSIRSQSILYMVYWHNRLKNNPVEQSRVDEHLDEYIGDEIPHHKELAAQLTSSPELSRAAIEYVEKLLIPSKTADLVITKSGSESTKNKDVLCIEREYYPHGLALPGGFIKDSDEDNNLGVQPEVFAALRVAGEKVLKLGDRAVYEKSIDEHGKESYLVHGESGQPVIRLYPEDAGGYRYKENIKNMIRPADPRHIVDTIGFRCVLEGETTDQGIWRNRTEIMDPELRAGGFAFDHHREIVAFIASQTSDEKLRNQKEHDFIRNIIDNPLEIYTKMSDRFRESNNNPETPMPELLPIIDRLGKEMFSAEINKMCEEKPLLAGLRDITFNKLRHINLPNRTQCPYSSTIRAIADSVTFFDIYAREKRGFYDKMPKDKIVEHNPAETKDALYHGYRYEYRFNHLLSMIPPEIIIPTFEPLSATDLLKVRGVPIRFVGISTDFLYVDEFEQSPAEFFKHDINHSWRMAIEDIRYSLKYGRSAEELQTGAFELTMDDIFNPTIFSKKMAMANLNRKVVMEESNLFIGDYLSKIKVKKADTEEEKEIKKLKKIILFEVVHEDARPFTRDVVGKYVQLVEGGDVPFEVPRVNSETGSMDVIDLLDKGISTLSYVRNKLQHGFYDQIDAQQPLIVDPRYRTTHWIAKAAYEMLVELGSPAGKNAELDEHNHVAYEWLVKRTAATGPDNVHESTVEDEALTEFGDGGEGLNKKRYQAT